LHIFILFHNTSCPNMTFSSISLSETLLKAPTIYAEMDLMVLLVEARMARTGADMMGMALNARIAHVWASSIALAVDAPLNRVVALSRALTVESHLETASTHEGTESIVDTPTTPSKNHVQAVSMVLEVDGSVVLVVDASTTHAGADSIVLKVDAPMTCAWADTLVW
jgi:hypothetical protein